MTGGWELPFTRVTQRGDSLCWAACVVSAAASSGNRTVSQSDLAHRFITSCRVPVAGRRLRGSRCDKPIDPDRMVSVWRYAGFPCAQRRRVPDDVGQLLREEIGNSRPVQAWLDRFHCVMVYGYRRETSGEEEVLIMDPQAGMAGGWRTLATARWSAVWVGLGYEGSRRMTFPGRAAVAAPSR